MIGAFTNTNILFLQFLVACAVSRDSLSNNAYQSSLNKKTGAISFHGLSSPHRNDVDIIQNDAMIYRGLERNQSPRLHYERSIDSYDDYSGFESYLPHEEQITPGDSYNSRSYSNVAVLSSYNPVDNIYQNEIDEENQNEANVVNERIDNISSAAESLHDDSVQAHHAHGKTKTISISQKMISYLFTTSNVDTKTPELPVPTPVSTEHQTNSIDVPNPVKKDMIKVLIVVKVMNCNKCAVDQDLLTQLLHTLRLD